MYERHHEPLLPLGLFWLRLARHLVAGLIVLLLALGIGVAGYCALADLSLVDAFLNAAMILSGMGPVDILHGDRAKLFAGCYALFSGLVFTGLLGYVLAPIAHRLLHKFHLARQHMNTEDAA